MIVSNNDRNVHADAMNRLKDHLTGKLNVPFKVTGIIIDQRGAAEKVFWNQLSNYIKD